MDNYIYEYHQKIQDGTIIAGKWIKMIYSYIIKGLENKSFFYDPKKARRAITFIETFCRHHEGRLAPKHIKLELWQKAALSVIFGVVDKDGCRQFREVIIIIGRKNGKTLFAAAIATYMMFADSEYGANVYFVAPKLDQAKLCFNGFYQTIQKEPELDEIASKRRTDIYVKETNSSAMPIAFSAKKSDGLNPHLTICDEIAAWIGDPGLKQYEVMKSALGARKQPLLLSISTAGYENEGIYDELVKRGTRVLKGDSRETRLLPLFYMIDDIEKWNDINELQKANPNLGVSVSVDYMLEEIAVAEGSLSKKREFITKYCNLKQNSSVAWLNTQTVTGAMCDPLSLEQFRGCYCVGGIDLSRTTDLTCALIIIEKENVLNVIPQFYLPRGKLQEAIDRDGIPYDIYAKKGWLTLSGDSFIDYHDCFNWFVSLVKDYDIYPLEIGYDRYSSQYLVQEMQGFGFHMDDVYQGENLTGVIDMTEGELGDGRIKIGDNGLMQIHMLDAGLKVNAETERRKLIKISKNAHVDGMAALLDAMCMRSKYVLEYGEQLKNAG